ncbi:hypothetical protein EXE51_06555 [Halorubrum sp. CGM5_25_10-8B]|nr:hypothetical protein EXE51_06555 [Halorubrum sp. CGM5_25_10-8B]
MSNTKQADGEIHEDQLLNFLVNTAADSDSSPSARRRSSRQGHPAQPLRHRTQASETASRGCFVRY